MLEFLFILAVLIVVGGFKFVGKILFLSVKVLLVFLGLLIGGIIVLIFIVKLLVG